MRGSDARSGSLFSNVDLETRVTKAVTLLNSAVFGLSHRPRLKLDGPMINHKQFSRLNIVRDWLLEKFSSNRAMTPDLTGVASRYRSWSLFN
jgi:hypothetical protein